MEPIVHYTTIIKKAKEAEQEGDIDQATQLYENAIKQKPVLEMPYSRLMIIYRKAKEYRKEMKVINKGLEVFTAVHDKKKDAFSSSGKVAKLSKAILKSVGGKVKDENYYPEPITKWLKRKAVIEKKLK